MSTVSESPEHIDSVGVPNHVFDVQALRAPTTDAGTGRTALCVMKAQSTPLVIAVASAITSGARHLRVSTFPARSRVTVRGDRPTHLGGRFLAASSA